LHTSSKPYYILTPHGARAVSSVCARYPFGPQRRVHYVLTSTRACMQRKCMSTWKGKHSRAPKPNIIQLQAHYNLLNACHTDAGTKQLILHACRADAVAGAHCVSEQTAACIQLYCARGTVTALAVEQKMLALTTTAPNFAFRSSGVRAAGNTNRLGSTRACTHKQISSRWRSTASELVYV
jgi:hypothetical protein